MNQISNHYHQTEAALYLYKRATDAVKLEIETYDPIESLRIIDADLYQLLRLLGFNSIEEAIEYVSNMDDGFKNIGDIEIDGITTTFTERIKENV